MKGGRSTLCRIIGQVMPITGDLMNIVAGEEQEDDEIA
jgi:hypothetical protein